MGYTPYKRSEDDGDLSEPFQGREAGAVVGAQYCLEKAEQFTLENAIFSKHWSIRNANGQEVYRVRGKRLECRPKRALVDLDGNPIVLMKQKRCSWRRTWRAFEPDNQEQPLWTLKKKCTFFSFKKRLAVILPSNTEQITADYTVESGFLCKKCIISFGEQKVAEVVREASLKNILTRKSIFHVLVQPGVDTAFIFSLIVILDRIFIHGCEMK